MRKLLFSCVCLALLLCGCNRDERKVVGVVPKGANHIFWQTVRAGAVKAAEEYGLRVEWNAPTLEIDASRQIAIVDSMVNRHLSGIAVAPVDRSALVGVVERAGEAKIPVAIFDSAIDTERRISYVATDNREGGRMAARRLGELLGGKGKVAVIGFMAGSASTMERESGFAEEIESKYPGIKIVQTVFGMSDRAKSLAATENVLNAHPDLGGLFADNESSSAGAVAALKARRGTKVKVVCFDSNDQLVAELKSGLIDSLIIQNPFAMGYEAVKGIGQTLKGEKPAALVDTGSTLVQMSNLETPAVQKLINPQLPKM